MGIKKTVFLRELCRTKYNHFMQERDLRSNGSYLDVGLSAYDIPHNMIIDDSPSTVFVEFFYCDDEGEQVKQEGELTVHYGKYSGKIIGFLFDKSLKDKSIKYIVQLLEASVESQPCINNRWLHYRLIKQIMLDNSALLLERCAKS